jgi:4-carboxymuconolactone decarboxylase
VRNGLTQAELEEVVLNVAAYAGFPAAMASSRKVDAGLRAALGVDELGEREAPPARSDEEREQAAAEVLGVMRGRPAADPDEDLGGLHAELGNAGVLAYRWSLGEIWTRPGLSRRDRSLSVIAILTSLGDAEELHIHVPTGVRNGLTQAEIEEAITHLTLYAGVPRAVAAMKAARLALADRTP